MRIANLRSKLQTYYQENTDYRKARISGIEHIQEGWESEIYSFDLKVGDNEIQTLILRIYPGQDAHEKSVREVQNLRRLSAIGYPVPKVFLLERDNSPLGRPFIVMEYIPGEMLWPVLFSTTPKNLDRLIDSFCKLFVELHQLDPSPFLDDQSDFINKGKGSIIEMQLEIWRDYYDRIPLPEFLPIFEWLETHQFAVDDERMAVLHWDFHPGNVILLPDESLSVIDWTGMQVSDPRFDLAWTLMLITAYEGYHWRKPFLEGYERHASEKIRDLDYFDVAACLRRLYSIAVSVSIGAENMGMRPGAENIMVKQKDPIHTVYNLLLERTGIKISLVEDWFV